MIAQPGAGGATALPLDTQQFSTVPLARLRELAGRYWGVAVGGEAGSPVPYAAAVLSHLRAELGRRGLDPRVPS